MSRNTRWGVPGNRADQPVKHSTLIVGRTATVNAAVTPDTVVAQAFVDTPSVTADANVTPTTVVAQVFIDTPAVTADANITPTTVTAQAFVDTPTVQTIRVIHIATAIHRKGQVQSARLHSRLIRRRVAAAAVNADVTPTTVVAQAFIDTPSVSGDANVTPTTVAAQASVDIPTVTGDANVTTTTVIAQAFVDTPTVTGDANVTTTTVLAQAFVDTPVITASRTPRRVEAAGRAARNTRGPQLKIRSSVIQGRTTVVSADANVTPDTVVATAFIDTPSVSTARALRVLAAPDRKRKVQGPRLRKRSTTVPIFPAVAVGNADVTAGDVGATASIPTPSVTAGRVLGQTIVPPQPLSRPLKGRLGSRLVRGRVPVSASVTTTTVIAQAFVDTPTVTGDANVTPDTVVAQAFVDTPGITASGDADVTAGAVPTEAFIPTPGVTGDANVTLVTVAAVVSIPALAVAADADITPTTVVGQATVPTPIITAAAPGDADVNLETVVAVVNMDALPLVEPGGLIRHRGLIGYGFSNSSPFGNRRP